MASLNLPKIIKDDKKTIFEKVNLREASGVFILVRHPRERKSQVIQSTNVEGVGQLLITLHHKQRAGTCLTLRASHV